MENGKNEKLGFLQEFHVLEIIIGDKNDSFEELKKLVAGLWNKDTDFEPIDDLEEPSKEVSKNTGTWEEQLLRLLKDSLNRSIDRTLKQERKEGDVFVKIIDLEQRKVSLEILVTIVTNLVNGFEQYGALRQAYDYFVKDVKKIFAPIKRTKKLKVALRNTSSNSKIKRSRSFFESLRFTNLFWNISGASIVLLEDSYTDHNKYKSLGAAILFTGCFAFISGCFALSYLTTKWYIILPIAFLWGITILNIDILIVNTMVKYERRRWSSIFGFIARILLATAIAFALSIPVEMMLLNDEIRDEIERYDRKNLEAEVDQTTQKFDRIKELQALKVQKEQAFNEEMQGDPNASGRRGYGNIAKKIEAQLIELNQEIEELEQKRDSAEVKLRKELLTNMENNKQYGFLASYRALHRLQYESEDQSVFHISWGIRILLLLIELLPIISKLLMSRGAYDAKYELEEYKQLQLNDRIRKHIP